MRKPKLTGLDREVRLARDKVATFNFGTDEWEAAMQIVRDLTSKQMELAPKEEFCSIDSGEHRTRLLNGKVI